MPRSPDFAIPSAVLAQEPEIELIFQGLSTNNLRVSFHKPPDDRADARHDEITVWIFILVLGALSTISLYLLWLKAD
jgi:hypothetical protein